MTDSFDPSKTETPPYTIVELPPGMSYEMRSQLAEIIGLWRDGEFGDGGYNDKVLAGKLFQEVLQKEFERKNAEIANLQQRIGECEGALESCGQPIEGAEKQAEAVAEIMRLVGELVAANVRGAMEHIKHSNETSIRSGSHQYEPAREAYRALHAAIERLAASPPTVPEGMAPDALNTLDTLTRVRFYEHDFYVLSNFSAFTLQWNEIRFDTSEAAYQAEKFIGFDRESKRVRGMIFLAPSAHEAFKIAEKHKGKRRKDWDEVKVGIMHDILRAKAQQHEYVRRKLLATGDRELVEDSWRDDFWGWGPNRDGQNMLGKLWMEIRAELRAALPASTAGDEGRG